MIYNQIYYIKINLLIFIKVDYYKFYIKGVIFMKSSTATKMRRVAGILYGVLFVYLMFLSKYLLSGLVITAGFSEFLSVGIALIFAAASVFLLVKDGAVSAVFRKASVIVSVFIVAFYLLDYGNQIRAIDSGLTLLFEGGTPKMSNFTSTSYGIWSIILFTGLLLLIILAAFFVTSSVEEEDEILEELEENAVTFEVENDEDDDDIVIEEAEVVEVIEKKE